MLRTHDLLKSDFRCYALVVLQSFAFGNRLSLSILAKITPTIL